MQLKRILKMHFKKHKKMHFLNAFKHAIEMHFITQFKNAFKTCIF